MRTKIANQVDGRRRPPPHFEYSKEAEGLFKKKAMKEVDAGRDHATLASVRHDDDDPLTPISPYYLVCVLLSKPLCY